MKLNDLLNPFRKPSAATLALEELEEAKRELLMACTAREYASSAVAYNKERIARLEAYIASIGNQG